MGASTGSDWRRPRQPRSASARSSSGTAAVGVNHCDTDVRRGVFGVAQTFPHVMGVDSAGEVAAVGPGVTGFKVGDRVAPHFLLSCGTCRNCIAGKENICLNAGVLGVTTWGTYAQFVKVRANNAVRLPDGLDFGRPRWRRRFRSRPRGRRSSRSAG